MPTPRPPSPHHHSIHRLLALLAALLLLPLHKAGAFPDRDPDREILLFPVEDQSPTAIAQGTWLVDDHGLAIIAAPATGAPAYWLPSDPWAEMSDGLVRAQVSHGTRADYSLLLRASAPTGSPDELDAYGLSVEKDKLFLHRWHRGLVHRMGPATSVPGLSKLPGVEIVAWMQGPWISVSVFALDSLEQVASLSIYDEALAKGRVGFRAFGKQDLGTRLESLRVAHPQQPIADPSQPWGAQRLVELDARDVPELPSGLASTRVRIEEDRVWLRTDPVGVERVRRANIQPISVSDQVPWWAYDRRYAEAMDQPPKATAKGFDLTISYKDIEQVYAIVRGYAERYPDITRLHTIGQSARGFPILALRITDKPDEDEGEPTVLLNGAHHGSELLSTEYTLDAMAGLLEGYASDRDARRRVDGLDIWVVPLVNPDANWIFMRETHNPGRKNGRDTDGDGELFQYEGVDLNRNYPFRWGTTGEVGSRSWHIHWRYRGAAPASEPETQAMMALADAQHFAASISYHTASTKLLSPYSIKGAVTPRPDHAWAIGEELVKVLPRQPNGRRITLVKNLYSVDGTDQDWHYFAHGTLAYLAEGSHHNPKNWNTARRSIVAMRPLAPALMDRVLDGPTISGVTVNEQGEPLQATITIDEIETFEGERWTSRARDGRFDRMLGEPGTYTVRATTEDGRSAATTVKIKSGVKRVELLLEPPEDVEQSPVEVEATP